MTLGLGKFTFLNSLMTSIFSGYKELKVSLCHDKMETVNEFVR